MWNKDIMPPGHILRTRCLCLRWVCLIKTDFLQSSIPLNLCNLTWKTELTSIRWHWCIQHPVTCWIRMGIWIACAGLNRVHLPAKSWGRPGPYPILWVCFLVLADECHFVNSSELDYENIFHIGTHVPLTCCLQWPWSDSAVSDCWLKKVCVMCAARTPSNSRSNPASETLGRSCQKGSDLRAEISFPSCWPQAFPSRDLLIWDAFEAYIMVVRSRIPEWLFWLATSTREVVFHSERHWLHHFLLTDFSIAKFVSKEAVFARDLSRASIRARWKLGGEWTCTRLLHELEVKVYM